MSAVEIAAESNSGTVYGVYCHSIILGDRERPRRQAPTVPAAPAAPGGSHRRPATRRSGNGAVFVAGSFVTELYRLLV
ncbi:hypothetical protein BRD01_09075 [Halobacteriales archaeon QS_8_65_32]|nr:MAG: hypothetical protein BRD01_09075 [Halobacteriales archaeon QS_8_65_32]